MLVFACGHLCQLQVKIISLKKTKFQKKIKFETLTPLFIPKP